ncbi:MAG: adenosylcobinamide-GDP ribazoletransferase [Chloroflexota bacterium]
MRWERWMWDDIRAAFSFLTILPLGFAEGRKPGWSVAWYPLVGILIGLLLVAIHSISPLDASLTAFVMLLAWVIITGGLHLDGFADSCDALLATVSVERRLDIMKDPRTGSWAVIGLAVLLLGKWVFLQTVTVAYLLLAPILGRWLMSIAVLTLPYARNQGLGSYFRNGAGWREIIIATSITLIAIWWLNAWWVAFCVLIIAIVLIRWAMQRLGGGITGDVYGALCEICEVLCLLGGVLWVSN